MKFFQAGTFADALKDKSVVEILTPSRKRSCCDDDASVKHSSPASDAPVKKVKLSASTTELVQTLLFDLDSYTNGGQLSLPSNPVMVTRKNKHAATWVSGAMLSSSFRACRSTWL